MRWAPLLRGDTCNLQCQHGGVTDKNDRLVHLYRTPMKSKRWYLRWFAYTIDLSLSNAWIVYKRDYKALGVNATSLKDFRIDVFMSAKSLRSPITRFRRSSSSSSDHLSTNDYIPPPVRVPCCRGMLNFSAHVKTNVLSCILLQNMYLFHSISVLHDCSYRNTVWNIFYHIRASDCFW